MIHRYREEFDKRRNPEAAAIRTLAMTGSALLGSALTTALFLQVHEGQHRDLGLLPSTHTLHPRLRVPR